MRRCALLVIFVAGAAACRGVTGLSDLEFRDPPAVGVGGAGGVGGVGGAGGDGGDGGASGCGTPLDAEGCPCVSGQKPMACYAGDNGPNSACNTPGTQVCSGDGLATSWGACQGASMPSAEACFD